MQFERTGETFFQIQNLVALAQYALARDELDLAEKHLRRGSPGLRSRREPTRQWTSTAC